MGIYVDVLMLNPNGTTTDVGDVTVPSSVKLDVSAQKVHWFAHTAIVTGIAT